VHSSDRSWVTRRTGINIMMSTTGEVKNEHKDVTFIHLVSFEFPTAENCFVTVNVFMCDYSDIRPTDGVSTLLWWWGLSTPETLRAMPAVA
jgi:hypothetical protein